MVALIRLESVAAASARKPSWAISGARFGEIAENAPTTTPIERKFAKPQNAKGDNRHGFYFQSAARLQVWGEIEVSDKFINRQFLPNQTPGKICITPVNPHHPRQWAST